MFSHFSHFSKFPVSRPWRGFGLIELMVSVAVMLLVATILVVKQSSFNGTSLLQSQAYEVALAAREAQLNAVSATTIAGSAKEMRGLYFNEATPNTYRHFNDLDGDGFYDFGEEYGTTGSIDGRFEISALRAGGVNKAELAIVFERPNYDARFFDSSGQIVANNAEIEIRIVGRPEVRTVTVTPTGQISVE
jgi:prepilin-type N-terminal cleavage/methylation domain-containing protein